MACILVPSDWEKFRCCTKKLGAREFGEWIKSLLVTLEHECDLVQDSALKTRETKKCDSKIG